MNQCVPSWDLEDINPNHDAFKLDYEVAELTWENGQLAMHELGLRRVPTKSQPTTSWDKPRAAETLEAIVNQATHQPYYKPQLTVNEDEPVSWLNRHQNKPTLTNGSLNALAVMTSDALVPSALDAGCSTRVGSCSVDVSGFMDQRVTLGHNWSSCKNMIVSESGTFGIGDTYDGDLGGQRLASTSTRSPENSSFVREWSKSTFPDDSGCHCTTKEANTAKEKKRGKTKSSISNKRRRTTAIHNQSDRKRRDKINQRMNTLQKLVPNSSKTDKASMLDEVIEYIKQLQAQVHMVNRMNISPMMIPLVMQRQQQHHQQQMQLSMMNSMCMGMGMGRGMGGMDMNTISLSNMPGVTPFTFMPMPSWNSLPNDRVINTTPMAADPMSVFLACRSQPVNMDSYSRMAALYQHMQNQPPGPLHKK